MLRRDHSIHLQTSLVGMHWNTLPGSFCMKIVMSSSCYSCLCKLSLRCSFVHFKQYPFFCWNLLFTLFIPFTLIYCLKDVPQTIIHQSIRFLQIAYEEFFFIIPVVCIGTTSKDYCWIKTYLKYIIWGGCGRRVRIATSFVYRKSILHIHVSLLVFFCFF